MPSTFLSYLDQPFLIFDQIPGARVDQRLRPVSQKIRSLCGSQCQKAVHRQDRDPRSAKVVGLIRPAEMKLVDYKKETWSIPALGHVGQIRIRKNMQYASFA